jgi:hypothetical protein
MKTTKKELIDFAKFHVQEALKSAADKAKLKDKKIPYEGVRSGGFYVVKEIDEKSILKAYPLKNIK